MAGCAFGTCSTIDTINFGVPLLQHLDVVGRQYELGRTAGISLRTLWWTPAAISAWPRGLSTGLSEKFLSRLLEVQAAYEDGRMRLSTKSKCVDSNQIGTRFDKCAGLTRDRLRGASLGPHSAGGLFGVGRP